MAVHAESATGQQPLKGVTLCSTSLSQDLRTHVQSISTELGARCLLDLTHEVTHLLIGSIDTQKYRWVARERTDIKVLMPEWITAVRDSWRTGEDVDVAALEEKHRVPTFFGLQICLTGFTDTTQRDQLSETIRKHGAKYHGDLIKQVTHLVAAVPQGAKYLHAMNWGIKVVSLKWFEDSLRRGMAVEESLYDPRVAVEEQGQGAWKEEPRPRTGLGKRGREAESQSAATDGGKKRLRRTASARLESQSQDLLHGMSVRDSISAIAKDNQWDEDGGRSVSDQPATSTTVFEGSDSFSAAPEPPVFEREEPTKPKGLFAGLVTAIQGFDTDIRQRLASVLQNNGAMVVESAEMLKPDSENPFSRHPDTTVIVPHAGPIDVPVVAEDTFVATEWWVERCLHYKTRIDPRNDVLSQPLHDIKIPGFESLAISSTGFTGVDLRQFAQAVKLTGAAYEENLRQQQGSKGPKPVLVSAVDAVRQQKAWYATRNNIPVVSAEWFFDSVRNRSMAAYDVFEVPLPPLDLDDTGSQASTGSPTQSERQPRPAFSSRRSEPPTRLSNTRRKHATPSLPLQASRPTAKPARSLQPFVHEDDDDEDDDEADGAAPGCLKGTAEYEHPARSARQVSQPLQELNPNASPHRKQSQQDDKLAVIADTAVEEMPQKAAEDSGTFTSASPAKQEVPETTGQRNTNHEAIASLAAIVQGRQDSISRPVSASDDISPAKKRKQRPLGRAVSSMNNQSFSVLGPQPSHAHDNLDLDGEKSEISLSAPAPPSTQLGYETLETEAHRQQMGKKMGLAMDEDGGGKRVASLGTVKDAESKRGPAKGVRRTARK